jgi:hypothetical protein
VFADGYDTVPLRHARGLPARLAACAPSPSGRGVLAGGDELCWANCAPLGAAWWAARDMTPPLPRFRNADAGAVAGDADSLAALYAWELAHYPADDQIALSRYLAAHPPDAGAVDWRRAVFANVALGGLAVENADVLSGRSGAEPGSTECTGHPFFAHLPYQAAEDGANALLHDVLTRVASTADPALRAAAAADVVRRWPRVLEELRAGLAWRQTRRHALHALAGALAAAAVVLVGAHLGGAAVVRRLAVQLRAAAGKSEPAWAAVPSEPHPD